MIDRKRIITFIQNGKIDKAISYLLKADRLNDEIRGVGFP